MAVKNYYAVLGVSRDETPEGIRAAYREAVRRTHPDHAGPQGTNEFQEIIEAHSVLSDPNRRRQYNESLNFSDRDRSELGTLHHFAHGGVPEDIWAEMHPRHPSSESVEVILTPEEAARGGILSIGIPVREVCGACGGTGLRWPFSCNHCRGRGTVPRMQPLRIRVPESLRLGRTPEVVLEMLGINNFFIKLLIRVSNEQAY